MYDFRDVSAANKDEQIRAWCIEQAIDMLRGVYAEDRVVDTAVKIENYVRNGVPVPDKSGINEFANRKDT